MNSQIGISLFAGGLVLAAPGVGAEEQRIHYFEEVAGTSISNALEGNTQSYEGLSSLGRVTVESYTLGAQPDAAISCPPGEVGLPLTAFSVRTDELGDQLYGGGDGFVCINFEAGTFTNEGVIEVTGGTGRFENASGQLEFSGTGTALFLDQGTLQNFSAVELRTEGYLYLPQDDSE